LRWLILLVYWKSLELKAAQRTALEQSAARR